MQHLLLAVLAQRHPYPAHPLPMLVAVGVEVTHQSPQAALVEVVAAGMVDTLMLLVAQELPIQAVVVAVVEG
jgi:hypothetical protein